MSRTFLPWGAGLALTLLAQPAFAQRVGENAAARAEDGFGASIGGEQVGIYSPGFVRGFSALEAGNVRLGGLYFDQQAPFSDRLIGGLQMRVGLSAQSYPFPSPTGIADYALRTPGEKQVLSVQARLGPLGGAEAEADLQQPITKHLSLGLGLSAAADQTHYGADPFIASTAVVLRWRPNANMEIAPFWSRAFVRSDEALPLIATDGTGLPPSIPRATLLGQNWAQNEGETGAAGVLARLQHENWTVRAGLFESVFDYDRLFVPLFLNTNPISGQAIEAVIAERDRRFSSVSGEIRVARQFIEGERLHMVNLSMRGRARERSYGGGAVAVLGARPVQSPVDYPRPDFVYGPQTRDRVEQSTLGLAYEVRWRNVGEFSFGVQRSVYEKSLVTPRGPLLKTRAEPWLFNATAAAYVTPSFALYAGYTQGLEESPTAPDTAINRDQAFPAIRTQQSDAGFRWTIRPGVRLVAGVFEVSKPFFGLDRAGAFAERGDVRNRGAEVSFLGQVSPQWLVVAGTSLIDSQASGESVTAGILGKRPIGSFRRLSNLVVQHRPAAWPGATFDVIAESSSDRIASADAALIIPARTTWSVGARHRLTVAGTPASLRVLLANVGDVEGFGTTAGGLFVLNQPRRLSVSLTVDW